MHSDAKLHRMRLVPIALFGLLATNAGCNACKKCQAELDHMASKIEGQACNPNFMQKALGNIEDECSKEHPDWELFVSQMTDQCQTFEAPIESNCDAGPGFSHAFPLAMVPEGGGGASGEAVLLNSAGAELFVGPWEGEGYTITASAMDPDEMYTFGLRNVGDTTLTREVSFEAPQRAAVTWSPYAPRTVRIGTSVITLENFEVDPAMP